MAALQTAIPIVWVVFWVYWLASAAGAKQGTGTRRTRRPPGPAIAVLAFLLLHAFGTSGLAVHEPTVQVVGAVVFVVGLGLAVWARVCLGRNWGMPMTRKDEPELVTTGPYRYVRHPIYTGILLGMLGTALATNLYWLIVLAIIGAYFVYSARVEERIMTDAFPAAYPGYRAQTKMIVPFVF